MVMGIKPVLLFFAFVPNLLLARTNDTGVVKLTKSGVFFNRIRGDPERIDPVSALIMLSGDTKTNHQFCVEGRYRFVNAVGPFPFVDIKTDKTGSPASQYFEYYNPGGMATQIVSCVTKHEPTFETAVRWVRDVKTAIAREARIEDFVESNIGEKLFVIKTKAPERGGWYITISVKRFQSDLYEYRLLLERRLNPKVNGNHDIVVDVDI